MHLLRQAEPAPNCCRSRLTHSSPRWSRLDCCGAFLGKGKYELTAQSRDGRGAAPAFLGSHPVSPEDAAANGESKEPEVPWRVWAAPSVTPARPTQNKRRTNAPSPAHLSRNHEGGPLTSERIRRARRQSWPPRRRSTRRRALRTAGTSPHRAIAFPLHHPIPPSPMSSLPIFPSRHRPCHLPSSITPPNLSPKKRNSQQSPHFAPYPHLTFRPFCVMLKMETANRRRNTPC